MKGKSTPNAWARLLDFFFEPSSAWTLSWIRMGTGLMVAYVHCIWLARLTWFMGEHALIDNSVWHALHANHFKWTYLAKTTSLPILTAHEVVGVLAGLAMAAGFLTRLAIPLAWLITLLTAHRMTGFLFGLDQIVIMLSMYLMLSPCGDWYSVDHWLATRSRSSSTMSTWTRWSGVSEEPLPSWNNTVATRLIQLHLCVIYLFGALGKLRGDLWWDGSAIWFAASSYEYQSLDMTWIGRMPVIASIVTHTTLFWELSYCWLVWPRYTRYAVLAIALLVHGGIALFMGMITFGCMMILANVAFIPPRDALAKPSH